MNKWIAKNLWNLQAYKYDSLIADVTKSNNVYLTSLIPKILSNINTLKSKSKILEVGCGNGYLANKLTRLGYEVDAIDSSPAIIRVAKKRYSLPRFIVMDAEQISKINKKYHAVIANLSIHDITNINKVVARIYEVLIKDGLFIFSIPHPSFYLPSSQDFYLGKNKNLIIEKYRTTKKFLKKLGNGIRVYHYHHTVGFYFELLFANDFKINGFDEIFSNNKNSVHFEIPAFVVISCIK